MYLIDRQEAIDIVYRQRFGLQKLSFDIIMEKLSELPSAQPEIVRCKDCEYFSEPNSFSGKCTLRGDYIFTNDFCSYAVERRTDERFR